MANITRNIEELTLQHKIDGNYRRLSGEPNVANSSSPGDWSNAPAVKAIDPVERDIKQRLEADEGFASATLREISETDRASIDTAFLHFFPNLQNVRGGYWSNLPLGTKLSQALRELEAGSGPARIKGFVGFLASLPFSDKSHPPPRPFSPASNRSLRPSAGDHENA